MALLIYTLCAVTSAVCTYLLSTAYLRDGSMLFMIGVAPQSEANTYADVFARVRQNMRIADR